jgi:hypothetical protein
MTNEELGVMLQKAITSNMMNQDLPRIEYFSGNSEQDVTKWIANYETQAKARNWDKNMRLRKVSAYLKDTASDWYIYDVENPKKPIEDWDVFVELMKKTFLPADLDSCIKKKLKERKQGLYESVSNYILEKRILCMKLHNQMSDKEVIENIYEGIHPELSKMLYAFSYENLEDFLEKARNIEKGLKSSLIGNVQSVVNSNPTANNYQSEKTPVDQIDLVKVLNKIENNLLNKIDERMSEVMLNNNTIQNTGRKSYRKDNYRYPVSRYFTERHYNNESDYGSYNNTNNNTQRNPGISQNYRERLKSPDRNNTRTTDGKPICYQCGKTGHIARFCAFTPNRNGVTFSDKELKQQPNNQGGQVRTNAVTPICWIKTPWGFKASNLVLIDAKINSFPVTALLDSGSCTSLINIDVVKELGYEMKPYTGKRLKAVNDEEVVIYGQVKLPILFGDEIHTQELEYDFLVTDKMENNLILGENFLEATGAIIDYSQKKVTFVGKGKKMYDNDLNSDRIRYAELVFESKNPIYSDKRENLVERINKEEVKYNSDLNKIMKLTEIIDHKNHDKLINEIYDINVQIKNREQVENKSEELKRQIEGLKSMRAQCELKFAQYYMNLTKPKETKNDSEERFEKKTCNQHMINEKVLLSDAASNDKSEDEIQKIVTNLENSESMTDWVNTVGIESILLSNEPLPVLNIEMDLFDELENGYENDYKENQKIEKLYNEKNKKIDKIDNYFHKNSYDNICNEYDYQYSDRIKRLRCERAWNEATDIEKNLEEKFIFDNPDFHLIFESVDKQESDKITHAEDIAKQNAIKKIFLKKNVLGQEKTIKQEEKPRENHMRAIKSNGSEGNEQLNKDREAIKSFSTVNDEKVDEYCNEFLDLSDQKLINKIYKDSSCRINFIAAMGQNCSNEINRMKEVKLFDSNKSIKINDHLNDEQKNNLKNIIHDFESVFAFDSNNLGKYEAIKHKIDTDNAEPVFSRPYKYSPAMRNQINKEVEMLLRMNVIEESHSPWASPVILLGKKNTDEKRLAVDYRKLNSLTKKDVYPLPSIADILSSLNGSKYFCLLDANKGFHQILMDENSIEKTTFITQDGIYQYKRMCFGLCNAPSTYQRAMNTILAGLTWNECLVYIDDILVFAKSFDEMCARLKKVLTRIKEAKLTLKPEKCSLGLERVLYLGHEIDKHGITPDLDKVKAITKFPRPQNITDVRSFLGLSGYYRKFMKNYADIARPLHLLLKKNTKFIWDSSCDNAFVALKESLIKAPCLAHYDRNLPTILHCDSSGYGIGAVILQKHESGERPIAFASRCLSDSERKKCISEKECIAIIYAIEKFRIYIEGMHFKLVTDHLALQWLYSKRNLSNRLEYMALFIQDLDMEIVYKPGKLHKDVDALSRYPIDSAEGDEPILDKVLDSFKVNAVRDKNLINITKDKNFENDCKLVELIEMQREDDYFGEIYKQVEFNPCPNDYIKENYVLIEKVLYRKAFNNKNLVVCLPRNLFNEVLYSLHDDLGHFGINRTYKRVAARFFIPNLKEKVKDYVLSCTECQTKKGVQLPKAGLLQPIKVGNPFYLCGIDHVGPI